MVIDGRYWNALAYPAHSGALMGISLRSVLPGSASIKAHVSRRQQQRFPAAYPVTARGAWPGRSPVSHLNERWLQ